MRRFNLIRYEDLTGISGIGAVAEGVEFTDGKCVITWLTSYTSVSLYDDIETLIAIHGHNGSTEVFWLDAEEINSD